MSNTKTIELTYEEIATISCYISDGAITAKSRSEKWEEYAKEKNPDGSPKFKLAKRNSQFWREESDRLNAVKNKLEG